MVELYVNVRYKCHFINCQFLFNWTNYMTMYSTCDIKHAIPNMMTCFNGNKT